MAERSSLEGQDLRVRIILMVGGAGFVLVLIALVVMMGLYRLWSNGPQVRVTPRPIANATAPRLETTLFRRKAEPPRPTPAVLNAKGYQWRDAGHTRVNIPIERAMALVAARGAQGFDPVPTAEAPMQAQPGAKP